MKMLHYNEEESIHLLEQIPPLLRVTFAAACAERLLPAYAIYSQHSGRGEPETLATILERLWGDLQGAPLNNHAIQANLDTCMSLIPHEDDEPWVTEQPYAEDAATALAYALRARLNGESQEAAWAARCAYEAADHYVVNRVGVDTNQPNGEYTVLSHPVVQAELQRQRHDLNDLMRMSERDDMGRLVALIRTRAQEAANHFFAPFTT